MHRQWHALRIAPSIDILQVVGATCRLCEQCMECGVCLSVGPAQTHLRWSPCWLPGPAAAVLLAAMPRMAAALMAVTKQRCQRLSASGRPSAASASASSSSCRTEVTQGQKNDGEFNNVFQVLWHSSMQSVGSIVQSCKASCAAPLLLCAWLAPRAAAVSWV
jgi:hypothetical protein